MTAHRRLGLDRHQIRFAMQRHINERWQAAMVDFGRGWSYPICRGYIAQELNHAFFVIRRELLMREVKRMSFPSRHEHYLYLHRVVFGVRCKRLRIGAQEGPKWPEAVPLLPRLPT